MFPRKGQQQNAYFMQLLAFAKPLVSHIWEFLAWNVNFKKFTIAHSSPSLAKQSNRSRAKLYGALRRVKPDLRRIGVFRALLVVSYAIKAAALQNAKNLKLSEIGCCMNNNRELSPRCDPPLMDCDVVQTCC